MDSYYPYMCMDVDVHPAGSDGTRAEGKCAISPVFKSTHFLCFQMFPTEIELKKKNIENDRLVSQRAFRCDDTKNIF